MDKKLPEDPSPTPLWKRVAALLAALFVLFLTFMCTWALATGQLFWF